MFDVDIEGKIRELTKEQGMQVYDLEYNSGSGYETIEVFIMHDDIGAAVSIDDCARVSKAFHADEALNALLENTNLMVSSPGINRKLRKIEHFELAVNERIKVVYKFGEFKGQTHVGKLIEFTRQADGAGLGVIEKENDQEAATFNIADVKSAAVDVIF